MINFYDPFDLRTEEFVEDITNAFGDFIADGFDVMEEIFRTTLKKKPEIYTTFTKGIDDLYQTIQACFLEIMERFESMTRGTTFRFPTELLENHDKTVKDDLEVTENMDSLVDADLITLRNELNSTNAACLEIKQEICSLEEELHNYNEKEELEHVAKSFLMTNRILSGDISAIADSIFNLKTLIARANHLQTRHIHQKSLCEWTSALRSAALASGTNRWEHDSGNIGIEATETLN